MVSSIRTFMVSVFIAGLFCFASCTAPIDIETDNSKPVLVIYGVITDSLSYQGVTISASSPYFSNQNNLRISGATVTITTSDNEKLVLQEDDSVKGWYRTKELFAGKIGITYNLEVLYDFNRDGKPEKYEASSTMLNPMPIDQISVEPISIMGVKHYAISLFAQEPSGPNFYMWKYMVNDSLISGHITEIQLLMDEGIDGNYINGLTLGFFEDVSAKSRYTSEQLKDLVFLKSGDRVEVEMSNIEEGYFRFIAQSQKEKRGENPFFGGPSSNIQTNLDNGAVGYFSAYAISRANAITP